MDRQAERSASATRTPPLAVPSSFVITRPETSAICWKVLTWLSAFCPVVASSTRSVLCGASGSFLRITRTILASSSIRSARFCSRPAVSIIRRSAPSASALPMASKASAAGSEPSGAVSTGTPCALPPDLKLFDGRRAERVARGDHHLLAGRLELRGELADRRGLARAVHAHHQHHLRLLRIKRQGSGDRFHHPRDLGGQKLLDIGGAHHAAITALGHVGGDAHGGLHAHIGGDQKLFELFEHVVVERSARDRSSCAP
jgi:hypothetical protein